MFFQLKSYVKIYNRPSPKAGNRRQRIAKGDAKCRIARIAKMATASMGGNVRQVQIKDPDEPEQPQLAVLVALITLGVSTALVAVCVQFMANSIDALTATDNIGKTFVGLVLLRIARNAAEHATAVTVACKDKLDLAIGVAVDSSTQIALLVLPLIVVLGWIMGVKGMACMNPDLWFGSAQDLLRFCKLILRTIRLSTSKHSSLLSSLSLPYSSTTLLRMASLTGLRGSCWG